MAKNGRPQASDSSVVEQPSPAATYITIEETTAIIVLISNLLNLRHPTCDAGYLTPLGLAQDKRLGTEQDCAHVDTQVNSGC